MEDRACPVMPQFLITAPDGNKYRVTAPEGASEQDALTHFKENWQPQEQPGEALLPSQIGKPVGNVAPFNPWAGAGGMAGPVDPNLSGRDVGNMAAGAAAQIPGTPGDIETLGRMGINAL